MLPLTFGLIFSGIYWHQQIEQSNVAPEDDEFSNEVANFNFLNESENYPRHTEHSVEQGQSLGQSLRSAGVSNSDIAQIVAACKPFRNLNYIRYGMTYVLAWQDFGSRKLQQIVLKWSLSESIVLSLTAEVGWQAKVHMKPIELNRRVFIGQVTDSLWDSATKAGMDSELIIKLADIFAWQIDFNREVRPGDQWRLVVESMTVEGEHIGWGNILAGEYINKGELNTAVRFPQVGPRGSYFAPDGSSMRRLFLKSPLKFGRISSRFSTGRFHPVLQRLMPHNGVDYAAPVGTPIMSVGDGVVETAGRNGGSGIMVKIRHNSIYSTGYLHMSRLASGMRRGAKVEQGQIIGYVGSTGLATGPHVHFAFFEKNRYVDPQGRKFPSADPVPNDKIRLFRDSVAGIVTELPGWGLALQELSARETVNK